MAKILKATFTVKGVYPEEGGILVRLRTAKGKLVYFRTKRKDYSADQRVTLTYRKMADDGELVGARFSRWEETKVLTAPQPTDGRCKALEPSFRRDLEHTLNSFRDRGGRAGRFIHLEGWKISIDKKGRFEVWLEKDRCFRLVWAREVADYIIKQQIEKTNPVQ